MLMLILMLMLQELCACMENYDHICGLMSPTKWRVRGPKLYLIVQSAVIMEVEDGRAHAARLPRGQSVAAGHHTLDG